MNAVVFASGMERGRTGRAPARSWRNSGSRFHRRARSRRSSANGSTRRLRPGAAFGPDPDGWTPGPRRSRGCLSPYEFNPLNVNPLRVHLEQAVDFERLRATDGLKLFVAATNVKTGHGEIFRRDILTADHAMASACLPDLFQAVIIDGQPYWDGGYAGNPPLVALVLRDDSAATRSSSRSIRSSATRHLACRRKSGTGSTRSPSTPAFWRNCAPPTSSPA